MSKLLSIDKLGKHFGAVSVLNEVSFEIDQSEVIALLGPSGCGKTTTLRCISGLETPDQGEIRLGNKVLNSGARSVPPRDRGMGMVFQSYSVWPHMTVFENIAFGLRIKRLGRAEIAERVTRVLGLMEISHLAGRRSAQLSGGQLQRVALARTLVVEPSLVLFDEPLSNLDTKLRLHMRVEIRSLLKRLNMAAVYVTHDQSEASVVADRTAIMNQGRIEQIGTWEELYFRPATPFVAEFMGAGNILRTERQEIANGKVRLVFANGNSLTVTAPPLDLDVDGKVGLYVPREAIRLAPPEAAPFLGRLVSAHPGPNVYDLTIESDFGLLKAAALSNEALPAVGSNVGFAFETEQLHVLANN